MANDPKNPFRTGAQVLARPATRPTDKGPWLPARIINSSGTQYCVAFDPPSPCGIMWVFKNHVKEKGIK